MPFSIALAGKGGTGKTTLAGMLVKYLIQHDKKPVLAVDADCNANFNEVLGVTVDNTLGNAREEMKKGQVPSGMTKDVFMSMKLQKAVIETGDYDLVVMGQPEGQGCYCAANTLLSGFLERLTGNYPYMVMDNEAGMEHISRLTTSNVDVLLIVADSSKRAVQAALRIEKLTRDLNVGVGKCYLVINRAQAEPPQMIQDMVNDAGLTLLGTVPQDETIYTFDLEGKPTVDTPDDSPSVAKAFALFDQIFQDQ